MTILEAIDARHSVRAYRDQPIDAATRQQLDWFVEKCNQESGLHFFIRYDDPEAFFRDLAAFLAPEETRRSGEVPRPRVPAASRG